MKTTAVIALLMFAVPVSAHAAIGAWSNGSRAQVRLLAAGIGADGKLDAGIEIILPPGWHTYWRAPGEAGVPTVPDLSASTNIGAPDVAFPVPTRDEYGSNIYSDHLELPVSVPVSDGTRPVTLSLDLTLGVCQDICIPDEVKTTLTIPPGEKDSAAASELAAARALIPGPAAPGVFALDTVTRTGGTEGRPVFRFTGTVPDAAHADFFVEGPGDWAPYLPALQASADGKAVWDVEFSRLGSTVPIAGATFRVTIRSGDRAIDQKLALQ